MTFQPRGKSLNGTPSFIRRPLPKPSMKSNPLLGGPAGAPRMLTTSPPAPNVVAYISLGLWALVMFGFAPSAWRYLRGRYNLVDSYRTAAFFMAALWFGGLGRLIFLPKAEDIRIAILCMSCALAVYLLILARQGALR